MVAKMDTITIHFICTFLMSLGLISADMMVMKDMVNDTYPAYDEGTPNVPCMLGQPDPKRESGKPKLINIRYITATSNDAMFRSFLCIYTLRPIIPYLTPQKHKKLL